MMLNPITEEIRRIRRELAARFDDDLDRIVDDLLRQQAESGREYVRLPKRDPRSVRSTGDAMHSRGDEIAPIGGRSTTVAG